MLKTTSNKEIQYKIIESELSLENLLSDIYSTWFTTQDITYNHLCHTLLRESALS